MDYLKKTIRFILKILFSPLRYFPKRNENEIATNICIVSLHRLGDTVFTVPTVNYFSKNYNCTILCYEHSMQIYNEVFEDMNYIICPLPTGEISKKIVPSSIRTKVLKNKFDMIVDITGNILSASAYVSIRLPKVIGISEEPFLSLFYKGIIKRRTPTLEQMYFDAVKLINPNDEIEKYKLSIPSKHNAESILIHPFAGWKAKEWGVKNFISLLEELNKIVPTKLVSATDELNKDVKVYLRKSNINFMETNNTNELVKEIKRCSIFIGHDSGPAHLAALFGKKVLMLLGPTNYNFIKIFDNIHVLRSDNLKCLPKGNIQYCTDYGSTDCPSNECMHDIQIKDVLNKVNELLLMEKIL